jgi:hypothetical protein
VSGTNSVTFNPVVTNAGQGPSVSPMLSIQVTDSPGDAKLGAVVVSWPSAATGYAASGNATSGFVLQTNSDLTTANWGDYSGPVDSNGGINSVSLNKSAGSLFFRLKH